MTEKGFSNADASKGEFERLTTAFPDLRQIYEESYCKSELLEAETRAALQVHAQGIKETTQDMAIRFCERYDVIFSKAGTSSEE